MALSSHATISRQPAAIRLPLLDTLFQSAHPAERVGWLDLGPVQPALFTRLSGQRAWLHVAELVSTDDTGALQDLALPQAGPGRPGPLHHVLAWDRLNYLDPAALSRLAAALLEAGDHSLRIHALIHYRATEMPRRPMGFTVRDDLAVLLDEDADGARIAAPRYSSKALQKAMPGLAPEHTTLLNNGMQEFILVPDNRA
ncbi:MAG: hypothetical protein RQ729_05335 [Wenzhouxiangellaceae bacterium]|nr:hypothetical protein [Wenzhouxiangellaceae bacterium]